MAFAAPRISLAGAKTSDPMTYPERLVSVHARLLKEGKLYQGQG